jgi:NTE family protein
MPRERPRIGLALGGGGARGGAHVGVLSVLEELRIPIDCIAGTSMGALVGAIYAAGVPMDQMEREILEADWRTTIGSAGRRSMMPMQRKLAGITHSNDIELGISRQGFHGIAGLLSTQNIEGFFRVLVGARPRHRRFRPVADPVPRRRHRPRGQRDGGHRRG